MSRIRITKDDLINRLKDKFSNEDGTLMELDNYEKVNEYLKEVRKVAVEYKIEGFDKAALEIYNNDNLCLEYYFRHQDAIHLVKDLLIVFTSHDHFNIRFSEYIDWCYQIGMTEKNQIRNRLEFYDKSYINSELTKSRTPLTKVIRKYRYLYKQYEKEEN